MTAEDVEALAIGGAILGGGGGGWYEDGRRDGMLALDIGEVRLLGPEEAPDDMLVAVSAALGAPTQKGNTRPRHFIRSAELLWEAGVDFGGLVAAENGGHNSFGGWIQAAALGLPVVDAPADGRAHPTAMMGGMGLQRLEDYVSVKAVACEEVEAVARGSLQRTSNVARMIARDVRALVAMTRDPVTVAYAREHGAPGAISKAVELGDTYLSAKAEGAQEIVKTVLKSLGGRIRCEGRIVEKTSEARGGFDVGIITIEGDRGVYEVTYVNEYMTLERDGERLGTFPDLICTFGDDGSPMTSASIEEGDRIYLTNTDKDLIPIGDGNRYPEVYEPIERVLRKPMVSHLKGFLKE
ncbi:MAG: DUF917 family protein [Candidatus Bathyarchaeota archaeon]|nr:DUF917 family protein [Candidatus Bathyarchaeota archaeon]